LRYIKSQYLIPAGNVIKLRAAFNCLALQGKDKMLIDRIGFSPKKNLAKACNTKTIAITALKGGANYRLILKLMTLPYRIK
jgi:hypothetical protein